MSVPIAVMVVVGPWPGRESLCIPPRALSLAGQSALSTQETPQTRGCVAWGAAVSLLGFCASNPTSFFKTSRYYIIAQTTLKKIDLHVGIVKYNRNK